MSQDLSFELINSFARYFNSIVLEALPFIVLGVVLAGILEEFVPQEFIKQLFSAGEGQPAGGGVVGLVRRLLRFRVAAIALGCLLGLVFPMCECGIIAIMRRLIRKGVPLSVCISYMLAGPIINVVVMLSTYAAFNKGTEENVLGGPLSVTALRVGLGFVTALVAGLFVNWLHNRHGNALLQRSLIVRDSASNSADRGAPKPFGVRLRSITETALHDFVDIMAFLILGACLATVGRMSLENEEVMKVTRSVIAEGHPSISIILMIGIGIVFCLCSEADAFVAANFPRIWPPASKLAFLVLGPMFDLKLLVMWTQIFRRRLIVPLVLVIIAQVFVYTMVVHYVWPNRGYSKSYIERKK